MKVFVIGSVVPFARHTQTDVTAVNIVMYELVVALAALGHKLELQIIFSPARVDRSLTMAETAELANIRALGVTVLGPVFLIPAPKDSDGGTGYLRRFRLPVGDDLPPDAIPALQVRAEICERIDGFGADVMLAIWSSEGVAATHACLEIPRIAFQGDVDFAPAAARLKDANLFGLSSNSGTGLRRLVSPLRQSITSLRMRRAHWNLMQSLDVIANVSANNAAYYGQLGHRRSIYVRNTWSNMDVPDAGLREGAWPRDVVDIVGHIGQLGRTGSTYGLRFLLTEVMPQLELRMENVDYRVNIVGGGEVTPGLRPYLNHPNIARRGYVADLDEFLIASDMLLLLNNAGRYWAAYTRHILAWSLGLCLIVHANSAQAIPEIEHMENALVGSTSEEVAEMIFLASTDSALNARIRQGGRATYEKYFTPAKVAAALSDEFAHSIAVHGHVAHA